MICPTQGSSAGGSGSWATGSPMRSLQPVPPQQAVEADPIEARVARRGGHVAPVARQDLLQVTALERVPRGAQGLVQADTGGLDLRGRELRRGLAPQRQAALD